MKQANLTQLGLGMIKREDSEREERREQRRGEWTGGDEWKGEGEVLMWITASKLGSPYRKKTGNSGMELFFADTPMTLVSSSLFSFSSFLFISCLFNFRNRLAILILFPTTPRSALSSLGMSPIKMQTFSPTQIPGIAKFTHLATST